MSIDSIVSTVNEDKTGITEKSADQWREEKLAELNNLWALLDQQTANTFASPEKLDQHLRAQARLGGLSASNVLLVEAQLPGAREVRTFDEWKKQEASIKKGEKALNILVPVQLEKDGEERTYFNISRVFDVSQTTVEPSPDAPAAVTDSMVQALLQSARTEAVINDNLPEFFTARFNSATNIIELRADLKDNVIATIARPVAMAYRQQRGKPSDSHLSTLTATILAYRIDPSAQIIRESLALCIDHVTPNDAKELRALLTEAAKDAKELHSSYLIHHRELTSKKKTRDVER